ncbi:GMC family oxidoreductase [Massilia atriviolacea]|uniref:GMC family oxidoreductase n=1 Tax=Massilia atriviolacea TaxID=2495579 RepID=A0A430HK41_9BURK|nr:GMC family oxidoreductase N-terminal domain-containing protein [Massilia atriviolacea]RSZ57870.1 GMC family oxidoreductase [Massilia atriviolacea]
MPETISSPAPSFDAIVVGSGPGGASVARELASRGLRVLILEQGSAAPLRGTLAQMARIAAIPGKGAFVHRDASLLVQGVNAGGSSSINFATAADPPLARFAALGIDLAPALASLRAELPIGPLPDALVGPAATRILQGALALGLDWRKLDKMIRPQLCRAGCWRCVYGCPFGAKWSARDFIDQACTHGAVLRDKARATRVLVNDGKAAGVDYVREGKLEQARAPLVVLAGGGVGSPRLLHGSGLRARASSLFSDPVLAVMGTVDGLDGGAEVPMAAGMRLDEAGISLADMTLPKPMYQAFTAQAGRFDRLFAHRRTLSLMVKIADRTGGAVGPRWVDKTLHQADRAKLARGEAMARAILARCGATHVFASHHFAAHPGGSVPIGDGVDASLQAGAAGLYVCDASVIPGPWGLPPTLTLLCLGTWLGRRLAR